MNMRNDDIRLLASEQYIVKCQAHPVLVKSKANQVRSFKRLPCRSCPPVDGPKDPWPRVLSLPRWFVGDPASLACDYILQATHFDLFNITLFGRWLFDSEEMAQLELHTRDHGTAHQCILTTSVIHLWALNIYLYCATLGWTIRTKVQSSVVRGRRVLGRQVRGRPRIAMLKNRDNNRTGVAQDR